MFLLLNQRVLGGVIYSNLLKHPVRHNEYLKVRTAGGDGNEENSHSVEILLSPNNIPLTVVLHCCNILK